MKDVYMTQMNAYLHRAHIHTISESSYDYTRAISIPLIKCNKNDEEKRRQSENRKGSMKIQKEKREAADACTIIIKNRRKKSKRKEKR